MHSKGSRAGRNGRRGWAWNAVLCSGGCTQNHQLGVTDDKIIARNEMESFNNREEFLQD